MPSYTNYTPEAERAECDRYVLVSNINKFLGEAGSINISVQSERVRGLKLIADLQNLNVLSQFYDDKTRFPERTANNERFCVIDIDSDGFSTLLGTMKSSCSYKTPDVSNTDKDLTDKSSSFQQRFNKAPPKNDGQTGDKDGETNITSMSERKQLNDAIKAYNEAIVTFTDRKAKYTLTLRTFETKYGLIWK